MNTFDPGKRANKFVQKLKEYRVTSQEVWGAANPETVIKADWNEAGIPPSPKVHKTLLDFVSGQPLQWYPDVEATELRQNLATYANVDFEETQVFSGSDAALEYFCRAFLDADDEVLIRIPTYDNFRVYAESCGAKVVTVNNPSPFKLDITPILEAITDKTKIIYLVNPDNPTGVSFDDAAMKKILKAAPHALVVSDEAYYEFHKKTATHLLKEFPNLVVSRSFSKAFALAGLRIGYLIARPETIAVINKIRVGKNVNSLAQLAAIAALNDLDYLNDYVKEVDTTKPKLVSGLEKLGYEVTSTTANFIMVKVTKPTSFASHLKNNGIYIRDRSYLPQLEGYVRITVGTEQQAHRILSAAESFLEVEDLDL
jgi:histidinol-phosphate aminotransferase